MPKGLCSETLVVLLLMGASGSPLAAALQLSSTPVVIPAQQQGSNFASDLGNAGDVNGDGYVDLIVGASEYENGQSQEGNAVLYYGGPAGFSTIPDWSVESDQISAWMGYSVSGAGDVNGDGFADVIVGAFRYTGALAQQGRAFLYLGSSSGPSTTPDWTTDGEQSGDEYGSSVSSAGDVNQDGFDDVIVAAADVGLYLYLGSSLGLPTVPSWTFPFPNGSFLSAAAGAGDVNGDGYNDVIVGDVGFSNPETAEGRAMIFLGSPVGLEPAPVWQVEGNGEILVFGQSVASAGDVNADGFDDVIVGSYQYDGGLTDVGKAWLYLGSPSGPATAPAWTAVGDVDRAWFGWNVTSVGDVDGDSYDDVAINARNNPTGGRAYVYRGGPAGLEATPAWDSGFNGANGVGFSGDLDGDGRGDVLVGLQGVAAHIYSTCSNAPIANAGPDRRVKPHELVTFNASRTQGGTPPYSYEWDLNGDGIPDASGLIATFRYTAGDYTAMLTVTDAWHCVGTDSASVTTRGKMQRAP